MTKKLIATLLAALLLLSLGAVGASALSEQEELEAEAWALINQAKEFYANNAYSMKGILTSVTDGSPVSTPIYYVSDPAYQLDAGELETESYALLLCNEMGFNEATSAVTARIMRFLCGPVMRGITVAGIRYTALPSRFIYYRDPDSVTTNLLISHLNHNLEEAQLVGVTKTGNTLRIVFSFPSEAEDYRETFEFVDGSLWSITAGSGNGN